MRVSPLLIGVVVAVLPFHFPIITNAAQEIDCRVTAYYTPAKTQEDFEEAVQMNGQGTHGADGTPVYYGMISAPKTYPFGTKIFIPGYGNGEVHDRGGAIVGNTFDVWMGYGEEGKKKALLWGVKKLTCIIDADLPEEKSSKSDQDTSEDGFSQSLEKGDMGDEVQKMQKFLQTQGFFNESDFGTFGKKTQRAVYQFQKKHKIVKNMRSEGAGTWGPKTREKANEILLKSDK